MIVNTSANAIYLSLGPMAATNANGIYIAAAASAGDSFFCGPETYLPWDGQIFAFAPSGTATLTVTEVNCAEHATAKMT